MMRNGTSRRVTLAMVRVSMSVMARPAPPIRLVAAGLRRRNSGHGRWNASLKRRGAGGPLMAILLALSLPAAPLAQEPVGAGRVLFDQTVPSPALGRDIA